MANVEHSIIANADLHEPKGVSAATAGAVIAADGAGGSATTNNASTPVNLYDNELIRPKLKDYSETVKIIGNTGTTETLNLTEGNVFTATMDSSCTFTFSNPPATGSAGTITLILAQGSGGQIATWPASVVWAGGTAPTLSTGSANIDILTFLTVDGGTIWNGFTSGLNFS